MAGVNLIKRLVQLGLLDSKNVDNARQVKSATTRYENIKKENSVFAKREKLAAKNNFDTVIKEEKFPKNIQIERYSSKAYHVFGHIYIYIYIHIYIYVAVTILFLVQDVS